MVFDPESLGFAPGTLIQMHDGLLPTEQIRVGMLVLAQPEAGGERAYRRVLNTMASLDQEVYAVQVKVAGADSLTTLFATGGHPFWVEAPLVDSAHWMATECLEPGFVLQLADGSKATVHAAGLIRQTQFPEIGFAADERAGVGIVLDLSTRQAKLASDAVALKLGQLEVGEPWLTPVYNFEVEEFHTYYVGYVGVWVNNSNSPKADAIEAVGLKSNLEAVCFPGDTSVLTLGGTKLPDGSYRAPIEETQVGDYVLSRCEITGETDYKCVTKVFNRGFQKVCAIGCKYGPEFYLRHPPLCTLLATSEHPFWVVGKGWTKVRDLQSGDEFLTYDGTKATCTGVVFDSCTSEVFSLEVADFHTYFVESAGIWVHNCNHKQVGWAE